MKLRNLLLIICLFFTSFLMAQEGPAQQVRTRQARPQGPRPMDTVLLKNYRPRSSVVVHETFVPRAKYPAIDIHSHVNARTPEQVTQWVKTMDETGVEMTVVLTGATGEAFDRLVDLFLKPYPDRFQLWCGLDVSNIDKPDFPKMAAAELERCYRMGARGIGEIMEKGPGFARNNPNDKVHPDDPRMDAFWEKAAELKMPVSIHFADHPSCWTPLDDNQERPPSYQQYNQMGKDVPSYEEVLEIMERTLAKHPNTIFIACHLANEGNDLEMLSKRMDRHPNLYLDISARNYEIGRTPHAAAKFLTKYSKKVIFGTDLGISAGMYQRWWRLLETSDEYLNGYEYNGVWWMLYGLELPSSVLKPLYRDNARKIMNWSGL
jgi:predicted TIM-barrel fold metal-dependent hydrolase